MAQIAAWRDGAIAGLLPKAGGTMSGAISDMATTSTIKDPGGTARTIGYRGIPTNAQTSAYVLAAADVGKKIRVTTGGVTVPLNASVAIDTEFACQIYNHSSSNQTITQAVGVTLRLAGTSTTGNRTLAQRGIATLQKVDTDEWVISGSGLS